ncbi:MAG: hypothetical protein JJ896_07780 [Rhodothermales bacterium]|nr:hypothetical protein [Rhodothermales bacterium]MBO6779539.1 hypothetical protein [Rhodothermales bacterium]
MDKELQLIEHLYDEVSPDTPPLRELLEDPDLSSEYQALSQARFVMEHRPRVRPHASVVNAVVRGATPGHATDARADRPALRRLILHRRTLSGALALAAVLALTVMVSPWTFFNERPTSPVADRSMAQEAPADIMKTLPPAATPARSAGASAIPEWDSGDDLRTLSRRIKSLQASGELQWDEPAVPLELLPTGATQGVRPAGNRR